MSSHNRVLGISGEDAAAAWYEAQGYEIVARNWRCREGELDLIVRHGRTFVFCEVKSKSGPRFGAPVEAITRQKQARLRRLAARWHRGLAAASAGDSLRRASMLGGSWKSCGAF